MVLGNDDIYADYCLLLTWWDARVVAGKVDGNVAYLNEDFAVQGGDDNFVVMSKRHKLWDYTKNQNPNIKDRVIFSLDYDFTGREFEIVRTAFFVAVEADHDELRMESNIDEMVNKSNVKHTVDALINKYRELY